MKIGDKVVCINNKYSRNEIANGFPKLIYGDFYTVKSIDETDELYDNRIFLEEIEYFSFKSSRFKTIKEWRKEKILKIENP